MRKREGTSSRAWSALPLTLRHVLTTLLRFGLLQLPELLRDVVLNRT